MHYQMELKPLTNEKLMCNVLNTCLLLPVTPFVLASRLKHIRHQICNFWQDWQYAYWLKQELTIFIIIFKFDYFTMLSVSRSQCRWWDVEQLVEWELARETGAFGGDLLQCHSGHHKSHVTWLWIEPRPLWWEADNCLATSVNIIHNWFR
jgi:hypothetical protein